MSKHTYRVRLAVQQIIQSAVMTSDASALFQLLLDQNEALQERVTSLEKSRPASVISVRTALEGADEAVNAADSSQPGRFALAQLVLGPKAQIGGHSVEMRVKGPVLFDLLQEFCLVVVRSWLRLAIHNVGRLELEVKDPYLPLKVSKTLGLAEAAFLRLVMLSMVSSVRRRPGPLLYGR